MTWSGGGEGSGVGDRDDSLTESRRAAVSPGFTVLIEGERGVSVSGAKWAERVPLKYLERDRKDTSVRS